MAWPQPSHIRCLPHPELLELSQLMPEEWVDEAVVVVVVLVACGRTPLLWSEAVRGVEVWCPVVMQLLPVLLAALLLWCLDGLKAGMRGRAPGRSAGAMTCVLWAVPRMRTGELINPAMLLLGLRRLPAHHRPMRTGTAEACMGPSPHGAGPLLLMLLQLAMPPLCALWGLSTAADGAIIFAFCYRSDHLGKRAMCLISVRVGQCVSFWLF